MKVTSQRICHERFRRRYCYYLWDFLEIKAETKSIVIFNFLYFPILTINFIDLICSSTLLLKCFLGHPCLTMESVMACFLASMYFPILCLSLTFQFCLNCLTVRIESTVHLSRNPPFDYDKFSVEKFYDVARGEFIYPKALCKTMPPCWTDRVTDQRVNSLTRSYLYNYQCHRVESLAELNIKEWPICI